MADHDFSLTVVGPLSIDMYLPALPTLSDDFHATTSLAQLSLTLYLICLAFGQLIAGPISDAHGRRRPLIIGLAIYAATSLLCALVSSIWLLIVLRLIQGLSGSAGAVITMAIVRDHLPGHAITKLSARLTLVMGISPILAPIVGGQILRFTSWHGIFIALGIRHRLTWYFYLLTNKPLLNVIFRSGLSSV